MIVLEERDDKGCPRGLDCCNIFINHHPDREGFICAGIRRKAPKSAGTKMDIIKVCGVNDKKDVFCDMSIRPDEMADLIFLGGVILGQWMLKDDKYTRKI